MVNRTRARCDARRLALVLICVSTLPGAIASAAEAPRVDASAIAWSASGDAVRILTVSGPGGVFSRRFEAGERPFLTLEDAQGQPLADGAYTWELRKRPGRRRGERTPSARSDAYKVGRVESGYFSISEGFFVVPARETPEGLTKDRVVTKDQVFNDDLIVDGSLCAGDNCVDGEAFGDDTLRLKEHNVRLRFDDTSTSPNYPQRDWQITINDKVSGGAEKFSIEDLTAASVPLTIEGDAPSHALYVDDQGRVGFGTSTPGQNLHTFSSDSPTLRLEQDGSVGFLPQTWDLVGNEAYFYVEDVSAGTIPFRVRRTAPDSSLDIHPSGRVGVATDDPEHQLDVIGSGGDTEASLRVSNLGKALVLLENRELPAGNEWTLSVTKDKVFEIAQDSALFIMDSFGDAEFAGDVHG